MATRPAAPDDTRRAVASLVTAALFVASFLGALATGLWAADRVVLWWAYGPEVVGREHLTVVHRKPFPHVSNGDTLEGWGLAYFVVSSAVCWPLFFAALLVLTRLLPREYREPAGSPSRGRPPPGGPVLLPLAPPFVGFLLAIAAGPAVAAAALAAFALAAAWLAAGRLAPAPGPGAGRH